MTFKVIDTKTGKEPTRRVISNIAYKGGLMEMDIDQFYVGEDGDLILMDDFGNITHCDTRRFKVAKRKEVLQEIRQKIDGLRYDHLIGNVSNYAVIDVALEIIDAHIAEEHE